MIVKYFTNPVTSGWLLRKTNCKHHKFNPVSREEAKARIEKYGLSCQETHKGDYLVEMHYY